MCGTAPDSVCEASCLPMSSLPLTANDTTSITDLEVPCALRPHVRVGANRKILGSLSDHGVQWSFIDWVKNHRSSDLDLEEDELRMCPLIWCRKTFDSKELAARHVLDCPRLSNGWYWCPYHRRPERYLECNKLCEIVPKFSFRNRNYKLHLADKFLNWIRRRRSEGRIEAESKERTILDEYRSRGYKEELSTGLDIQIFDSPGSGPELSPTSDDLMMTEWIHEKAGYQGDGPGLAEIHGDDVFAELASHQSVVGSSQGIFDFSFPTEPTEMPTLSSSQRSSRHRMRGMPAIDTRCSSTQRSSNCRPGTDGSGNKISSIATDTEDLYRVPGLGIRPPSIASSALNRQSDGSKYEILVSTYQSRKISDSSGTSAQSPYVETTISSSPNHSSLDLNKPLPLSPQRNSGNANQPSLSTPNLDTTHTSPVTNTSSNRFSIMDRVHRLSNRASVSNTDSETMAYVPTEIEMSWESYNQRQTPIMSSSSTDIEMRDEIPAVKASYEDPIRQEESISLYSPWNMASPSTLTPTADSPDSDVVSPCTPISEFSSPLSTLSSPISPIAESMPLPSNAIFPVTALGECLDLGMVKHHENAAGDWNTPTPLPLGLKPRKPEPTCSLDYHGSSLSIKRPVSARTSLSASGARWKKDGMPSGRFHPSHRRFQSENWHMPSVSAQTQHSRTDSSNPASFTHLSGIDQSLQSGASISVINSIMTQVNASNPWSLIFPPPVSSFALPALDIHMNSSFMNGSTGVLRAEMPAPLFTPVGINAGPGSLHDHPSSVGINAQSSPSSSPYPLEGCHDLASWGRRQMKLPPESISGSDISSPNDRSKQAGSIPRRPRLRPRSLILSEMVSQSQSSEGQEISGEVTSSKSDVTSAHQYRLDSPNSVHSPSAIKTMPHCFDHSSLLVTHSPSKQAQFEELEEWVGRVNTDWMQKLETVPELWLRCSVLSIHALIDKWNLTLRELFCGRLAQTFENVFALIHLAFAIVDLQHCQQNLYCMNDFDEDAFVNDAVRWQHAISDNEGRLSFLKAMDSWLGIPELHSNPLLSSGRHTSFHSITPRDSFGCSNQTELLEVLRNGEIIKACIGFFDGFEEATISERNAQFPAEELFLYARSNDIERMISHVTRPLQQERGTEALRRIVIDTELQIAHGLLQNTREVEVTLNTSGRLNSESPEVFERFHDIITTQCNKAVASSGSEWNPNWRYDYYIVDLDDILELSKKQGRSNMIGSALKFRPEISEYEESSSTLLALDSPAPWSSASNGPRTPDSSQTRSISRTSTRSSKRPKASTRTTSLTNSSQASVSPTSPPPNSPTPSVTSCLACSLTFKGSPQDAKSNLLRHLRNSPRHNAKAGLKCPLPECHARRPQRSDNLKPHLLKIHHMTSESDRQAVIDESKALAKRAESDGVGRGRPRRG